MVFWLRPMPSLSAAVEVVVPFQAGRLARRGVGLDQRVLEGGPAGASGPVAAAIRAWRRPPRFPASEIGQRVRIGPGRQSVRGPAVVVAAVTARIGHGVDRGRAADHLAAGAFDPAAVELRLGLGEIHPVVQAVGEDLAPAERNVDPRVAVPSARFQHQHAGVAVLGQPVGQHATRRARTNDDVVVAFRRGHTRTPHNRGARLAQAEGQC